MKHYSEYDLEKMYNDFLDEAYPECKIAGYDYSTSEALKEIDPTAYRCGFTDWLDSECQAGNIFEHRDGEYYDSEEEEEGET